MKKSAAARKRLFASMHIPGGLLIQIGWSTTGYAVVQIVRVATNLILTRLLAPELFGIMVLLTSLRVGIELFTDIGIGQGLIVNKRSRDETFYNTAWTMQIIRSVFLGALAIVILPVLRSIYNANELRDVLPALSIFLLLTGLHSIAPSIAIKEIRTKRMAVYDAVCAAAQAGLTISAVSISPTITGLIVGQALGSAFTAAASYLILPDIRCRFVLDRSSAWELLHFGKWIFLSSIIFFMSSHIDRLVLGQFSLALLGIYGIARSLGDIFSQFSTRMGNMIIFPKVAAADGRGQVLQERIRKPRLQFLAGVGLGVAGLVALAEPLIIILYDPRYVLAAQVLPWVGLATWLTIINTLNDSVILGVGKPHFSVWGNASKLGALVVLLPLGVAEAGIVGAAAATAAAEIARYTVMLVVLLRERLSFVLQDLLATSALLAIAWSIHALSRLIAPSFHSLPLFGGWAG